MYLLNSKKVEGSLSYAFVYVVRMIKGIHLFLMEKIFICFLISACRLTFTIIFYHHEVMNTFISDKRLLVIRI